MPLLEDIRPRILAIVRSGFQWKRRPERSAVRHQQKRRAEKSSSTCCPMYCVLWATPHVGIDTFHYCEVPFVVCRRHDSNQNVAYTNSNEPPEGIDDRSRYPKK